MDAIYIPSLLKAPDKTEIVEFREFVPGLETLMPVRGVARVTHQGTYLEVSASLETIVTLTCDRCLQQYNHRIKIEPSEPIWLDANPTNPEDLPIEQEVAVEDLVETLRPDGEFDIQTWIYEQLCLAIPPQKLCNEDCSGIQVETNPSDLTDSRWAALQQLKDRLPG
ncbi:metal-binding protein [Leptolyngbya valderiana BDU 20041]|nr:YceD family protein [Geitlerinema sp. CS-897]OAB58671.1 metal-binding protein [Leptolyngbya valderiana BDU 20041]PPT08985.1 hypothetical protein CKA32_003095 [Geitlerinema sp. FC II]